MADLLAEQILAAVKTLVTGLTTTGANVQRGQVYGHEQADLPALGVFMGPDTPDQEYQTGFIDWELVILIEATAEAGAAYTDLDSGIDTTLNQIRKEVHAAIMADHTLGLAFVIDTTPGPAQQPTLSGEGSEPTGSQVLEFTVNYRTSRADASV